MRLIKLYSNDVYDNIISPLTLKFKEVIYVIDKEQKIDVNVLKQFLKKYDIYVRFVVMNIYEDNFVEKFFEIICPNEDVVDFSNDNSFLVYKILSQKNIAQSFVIDTTNMIFYDLNNAKSYMEEFSCPSLHFNDFVELFGSSIEYHLGHKDFNQTNQAEVENITKILEILHQYHDKWSAFAYVVAELAKSANETLNCKLNIYYDKKMFHKVSASLVVFRALKDIHVINNLIYKPNELRISFTDETYIKRFQINGNYLEYDVYLQLLESKLFTDVQMSTVIDWNGERIETEYDPKCEIDVVATNKMVPIFISCKITKIDQNAIYQIHTLAKKFGGKNAISIIVSIYQMEAPNSILEKMKELNVYYFNGEDIVRKTLARDLYELSKKGK